MAIRVTQNTMYNNMVGHMQSNLSAYMESVQQGSSQKKINRPSDDPAGTYRVLTTRNDMVATAQYQENVDTAKGWLNLADSVLSTNVTAAITGLKALAEQASTGTYTAEQRMIMADQARQYFGQLLNLSNTQFEDMHIFGGHKYDTPAFQQGLAATSWDKAWDEAILNGDGKGNFIQYNGASDRSVLIQFTTGGVLDGSEPDPDAPITYKWSNDGGNNWTEAELKINRDKDQNIISYSIEPQGTGVAMTIPAGIQVTNPDFDPDKVTELNGKFYLNDEDGNPTDQEISKTVTLSVTAGPQTDPAKFGANNGTFITLRPTAYYQGDDKDPAIDVTLMGAGDNIKNLTSPELDKDASKQNPVTASGTFASNVLVRIDGALDKETGKYDQPLDLEKKDDFQWSYSTDGGNTWITARGTANGTGQLRLPVPGGYVDFNLGGTEIPKGMQANIHPSRADLDYEIMKDTYLSVNSVGKDVFGGYYEGKPAMDGGHNNLFEVVGKFIGYLESNNQEGCQQTLVALEAAEKTVLAEATRIGGLENRLEMAADVLSFQKLDQQERLSYTEDIDLTELLTKLTRQQLTYQTVLQSSSMIMQMSLLNYV